jgi:hypothetical protein
MQEGLQRNKLHYLYGTFKFHSSDMITLNALDILNPVSGNVISKEFIVPTAENIH